MTSRGAEIERLFANAGVVVAYLFGSRAQETARRGSDADVAVLPERRMSLLERELLADRLARSLGVADVDLVVLDEASLELRGRVVQEGKLLYSADESRRVAFEVRTRSEYLDFLPVLREHTQARLSRAAARGLT